MNLNTIARFNLYANEKRKEMESKMKMSLVEEYKKAKEKLEERVLFVEDSLFDARFKYKEKPDYISRPSEMLNNISATYIVLDDEYSVRSVRVHAEEDDSITLEARVDLIEDDVELKRKVAEVEEFSKQCYEKEQARLAFLKQNEEEREREMLAKLKAKYEK